MTWVLFIASLLVAAQAIGPTGTSCRRPLRPARRSDWAPPHGPAIRVLSVLEEIWLTRVVRRLGITGGRGDDEIISQALTVQGWSDRPVTLTTFDTGMAFTGRQNGLPAVKLSQADVHEEFSNPRVHQLSVDIEAAKPGSVWIFVGGRRLPLVVGDPVAVVERQGVECGFPAAGFAGHVSAILAGGANDQLEHLERVRRRAAARGASRCRKRRLRTVIDRMRRQHPALTVDGHLEPGLAVPVLTAASRTAAMVVAESPGAAMSRLLAGDH